MAPCISAIIYYIYLLLFAFRYFFPSETDKIYKSSVQVCYIYLCIKVKPNINTLCCEIFNRVLSQAANELTILVHRF